MVQFGDTLWIKNALKNELTPKYKLGNALVPVMSDITQNEFTVKDSFTFVDKIWSQNSDLCMPSLDVVLFTNIPLDETIDICVKKLFRTPETFVKGMSSGRWCCYGV